MVALSNSAPSLLIVPSSVSVPANTISAAFTAAAGTLVSDQPATITATLNGSSAAGYALPRGSGRARHSLRSEVCRCQPRFQRQHGMYGDSLQACAGRRCVSFPFEQPSVSSDRPRDFYRPLQRRSASFTASTAAISTSQVAVISAALGAANLTAAISLLAAGSHQALVAVLCARRPDTRAFPEVVSSCW